MRSLSSAAVRWFAFVLIARCACAQEAPAPAPADIKPPHTATRARSSTRTLPATVLSVDVATGVFQLALDGKTTTARVLDTSHFTKNNKPARVQDFAPNEKVVARLSFRVGGDVWLRDLWDSASHSAYTRDRRAICVGVVAANKPNRLDVRRADGSRIAFRVTDKTQVRRGGALGQISTYTVGAAVAVQPRALPAGEVMASIVAETKADIAAAHLDGLVNWKGTVDSVDTESGRLVLRRQDGVRRSIIVAPTARLRRGRATVTLKDLAPDTQIEIHLLRGADVGGQRTADAVTVLVPKERKQHETAAP